MLKLEGQRFGRLVAIEPVDKRVDGRVCWRFICDCGNEKIAVGRDAVIKHVTSCGCYRKEVEVAMGRRSFTGYEDLSKSYWIMLQKGAKQRNLPFEIEIEETYNLLKKQNFKCALSGQDIKLIRNYTKFPSHQTASLDRIDSNLGYLKDNIQWVHKLVNRIKSDIDNDEFINLCGMIYNYNKKEEVLSSSS